MPQTRSPLPSTGRSESRGSLLARRQASTVPGAEVEPIGSEHTGLARSQSSWYNGQVHMARILLIDDMDAVRGLFRAVLEQAGHVVQDACNGSEGIRLFRGTPADVVITDMYMPDGDGFDVIRQVRAQIPAVKILAISGRITVDQMLSAATLMGADQALPKPVEADALVAAVASLLNKAGNPP